MSASSSAHPLLPPITSRPQNSPFIIPSPNEEHPFVPNNTLEMALPVTAQSAAVGLLVSSVQNALQNHNHGAMGVFTRTGNTIAFFTAGGFAYSFVTPFLANIRQTNDGFNAAAGGCAMGIIAGAVRKSVPAAVGSCAGIGTVMGTFWSVGNTLEGNGLQHVPRPERAEAARYIKKSAMEAEVPH
ncbi:hypothetical protein IAT38_005481 [Cryptococcus sp. DSM 104549]